MNTEGTGILQEFNVGDTVNLTSLLYVGSMSPNCQAHEIFAYSEFFGESVKTYEKEQEC